MLQCFRITGFFSYTPVQEGANQTGFTRGAHTSFDEIILNTRGAFHSTFFMSHLDFSGVRTT